jgi:hypothetical protein
VLGYPRLSSVVRPLLHHVHLRIAGSPKGYHGHSLHDRFRYSRCPTSAMTPLPIRPRSLHRLPAPASPSVSDTLRPSRLPPPSLGVLLDTKYDAGSRSYPIHHSTVLFTESLALAAVIISAGAIVPFSSSHSVHVSFISTRFPMCRLLIPLHSSPELLYLANKTKVVWLNEIHEQFSQFDFKFTKLKVDNGGRELKAVVGKPGLSRYLVLMASKACHTGSPA